MNILSAQICREATSGQAIELRDKTFLSSIMLLKQCPKSFREAFSIESFQRFAARAASLLKAFLILYEEFNPLRQCSRSNVRADPTILTMSDQFRQGACW